MSVRETQNGTPRGAFFCGFCRSPGDAAAACSGYVDILRGSGLEMPPIPTKQRNMLQVFTHVGRMGYHRLGDGSGMKAPEWQGVYRESGGRLRRRTGTGTKRTP